MMPGKSCSVRLNHPVNRRPDAADILFELAEHEIGRWVDVAGRSVFRIEEPCDDKADRRAFGMLRLELADRIRVVRRSARRATEEIHDRGVVEIVRSALKADRRDRVVCELPGRWKQMNAGKGDIGHERAEGYPRSLFRPSAAPCPPPRRAPWPCGRHSTASMMRP